MGKELLIRSVNSKQKLEIIYLSSDQSVSQRVIRVLKVDGDMVLAFCYKKKSVRTFKIENILAISPVKRRIGA